MFIFLYINEKQFTVIYYFIPINKSEKTLTWELVCTCIVPPRIDRTNLKDITLRAGQNLKLDVKISGEPPPSKTWFLNKARQDSQDNLTIDSEDYKTKLMVVNISRKHTGTYTIKAENASGRDEASVEVTVLGEFA